MIAELVRGLAGVGLFVLLLLAPGCALASLLGFLDFRRKSVAHQLATGLLASLAFCPVGLYLLSRAGGQGIYYLLCGVSVVYSARGRWRFRGLHRGVLIGGCSAAMILLLQAAVTWDGMLFLNLDMVDHSKHAAVTHAITATGIPPQNPFFSPGRAIPLFYYYGWFLVCSLVERSGFGWLTPADAVNAATVYTLWALVAATSLMSGECLPVPARRKTRAAIVAVALLAVTGLDLLYWIGKIAKDTPPGAPWVLPPTLEWWNEQITSWLGASLWVTHHMAAFGAGLFVLLLQMRPGGARPAARAVAQAAGIASAMMMSVWVGLTFALTMTAWGVYSLTRRLWAEGLYLAVAGALALILVAPFLAELRQAAPGPIRPVIVEVRAFTPLEPVVALWAGGRPAAREAVRLLLLPLNYFLEFGFFAIAGVVFLKRRCLLRHGGLLVTALAVSLVIGSCFRSSLRNNDLGWRALMPAQMVLLLTAVAVLLEWRRRGPLVRVTLGTTLAVGVAGTVIDLALLRSLPILAALNGDANSRREAQRLFALRDAYRHVPPGVLVQHNPAQHLEVAHQFWGLRRVVASDELYGSLFGIDGREYDRIVGPVASVFRDCSLGEDASRSIAAVLGIDYWLVTRDDPLFHCSGHWMNRRETIYANAIVRIVSAK